MEKVRIGPHISVTVVRVDGDRCRLAIEAPEDVVILRNELIPPGGPEPDWRRGG